VAVFHGGRGEKERVGWERRRFWHLKKGVGAGARSSADGGGPTW
jgi:hypothetical protein